MLVLFAAALLLTTVVTTATPRLLAWRDRMSARPAVPVQPQVVPMSTNVLVTAAPPSASKP